MIDHITYYGIGDGKGKGKGTVSFADFQFISYSHDVDESCVFLDVFPPPPSVLALQTKIKTQHEFQYNQTFNYDLS